MASYNQTVVVAAFIKCDSAKAMWGGRAIHKTTPVLALSLCIISFWKAKTASFSASTWRDLDRKLKSSIHMHDLTHQPVAACGHTGIFSYANLHQSAFPRTAHESIGQQLPLHTNALQMKFIYSTPQLLLSLFSFLWIYSASFDFSSLAFLPPTTFLSLHYVS